MADGGGVGGEEVEVRETRGRGYHHQPLRVLEAEVRERPGLRRILGLLRTEGMRADYGRTWERRRRRGGGAGPLPPRRAAPLGGLGLGPLAGLVPVALLMRPLRPGPRRDLGLRDEPLGGSLRAGGVSGRGRLDVRGVGLAAE